MTKEHHFDWKGQSASYSAIHKWVNKHYPKTSQCQHCYGKFQRTEWANVSGDYLRLDREDWLELCPSCHKEYDRG